MQNLAGTGGRVSALGPLMFVVIRCLHFFEILKSVGVSRQSLAPLPRTRALRWSENPYGNGYGVEMGGNGAQIVKILRIELDLGQTVDFKRYDRHRTFTNRHVPWQKIKVQDPQGPASSIHFKILGSQGPMSSIHFRILGFQGPTSSIHFRIQGSHGPMSGTQFRILGSQGPMTSINFRIQSPQGPTS